MNASLEKSVCDVGPARCDLEHHQMPQPWGKTQRGRYHSLPKFHLNLIVTFRKSTHSGPEAL
jgi:hypothetical protein